MKKIMEGDETVPWSEWELIGHESEAKRNDEQYSRMWGKH